MTERLSYENGLEIGYERGLKAAYEDPNVLESYGWGRGYDDALDDARAAVARMCGHTKYEGCVPCHHDDAVAAIEALRVRAVARELTELGQELAQGQDPA